MHHFTFFTLLVSKETLFSSCFLFFFLREMDRFALEWMLLVKRFPITKRDSFFLFGVKKPVCGLTVLSYPKS